MSEISKVPPPGFPNPNEVNRYQQDYRQGLNLFQEAFQAYTEPDLVGPKKDKFKEVMDQALDVMNQTASIALKKGKEQAQEALLDKDYQAFIQDPTLQNEQKVHRDLDGLSGKN